MNNKIPFLSDLSQNTRYFICGFLVVMTVGVSVGVVYIYETTGMSGIGTAERN